MHPTTPCVPTDRPQFRRFRFVASALKDVSVVLWTSISDRLTLSPYIYSTESADTVMHSQSQSQSPNFQVIHTPLQKTLIVRILLHVQVR